LTIVFNFQNNCVINKIKMACCRQVLKIPRVYPFLFRQNFAYLPTHLKISQTPAYSTIPPGFENNYLNEKLSTSKTISENYSTSPLAQVRCAEGEEQSTEVINAVNLELSQSQAGRLFAVIHFNNQQRKITAEDLVSMKHHVEADIGERIRLNKVLVVGGKDFTLVGRPLLSPNLVRVEATVIEKTLSQDIIRAYYRRRKDFRRFKVKREKLTVLRINSIEVNPVEQ